MTKFSFEQKAAFLSEWQKSGLSKKAFCQLRGLSYWSFLLWVKASKSKQLPVPTSPVQIVQVGSINLSMGRQADSGVRLEVGNVKVGLDENFSAQALARVLEVLKQC